MTTNNTFWDKYGIKEPSREEKLTFYKASIDKTPTKWLSFHLDNAVKDEDYELVAYVRDEIKKRNES